MNKTITTLALGAIAVSAALPALAQDKPTGLSLRVGAFMPSDKAARDKANTWFTGGLDFKLKDFDIGSSVAGMKSYLSLSVDDYSQDNFRNIPLLLNWTGGQGPTYFSAGAGVGFAHRPNTGGGGSKDETKFAWSAAVGYNFQQMKTPLFIEARYFGNADTRLNGFAIDLGIRF